MICQDLRVAWLIMDACHGEISIAMTHDLFVTNVRTSRRKCLIDGFCTSVQMDLSVATKRRNDEGVSARL